MSDSVHTCYCGFTWEHGKNGSHICDQYYRKRIDELERRLAKNDADLERALQERDRAQDALLEASEAMGGPEWCAKIPPEEPPDSGDLHRDVPELCRNLVDRLKEAEKDAERWQTLLSQHNSITGESLVVYLDNEDGSLEPVADLTSTVDAIAAQGKESET